MNTLPSDDLDPAAPAGEAVTPEAVERTNFGDPAANRNLESPGSLLDLGHPARLRIDKDAALAFLQACTTSHPRVSYGLGAKVQPHGAAPGTGFSKVDCSGFVRELIWRATTPHFEFKDGSVVQHEWVRTQGFQTSSVEDGKETDGLIRIVFLSPQASGEGIGHVALILNGKTLESHGGTGPDSRPWTGAGWQARTSVFILAGINQ